jgi:hypothetical protein
MKLIFTPPEKAKANFKPEFYGQGNPMPGSGWRLSFYTGFG